MATDPFQHWRDSLSGKAPPIHTGEPHCGFYRTKVGDVFVAAAIYIDPTDGVMRCRVGGDFADPKSKWVQLARRPIAEDAATYWFEHGRWPAEPEPQAAELPNNEAAAPLVASGPRDPVMGDNSGATSSDDPTFDLIARKAKVEVESALEWLERTKIETQAQADIAGDKIGELRKQISAVKAAHKVEKQPFLDGGREVDEKYRAIREPLESAADALKRAAEAWAVAEQQRRQQEAAAAEAARVAAINEAEAKGEPIETLKPVAAPEPVRIGGSTGKRVGFKTVKFVLVTDYAKALRNPKVRNHPTVLEAIQDACSDLYEATGKVPAGCEEQQETRAA